MGRAPHHQASSGFAQGLQRDPAPPRSASAPTPALARRPFPAFPGYPPPTRIPEGSQWQWPRRHWQRLSARLVPLDQKPAARTNCTPRPERGKQAPEDWLLLTALSALGTRDCNRRLLFRVCSRTVSSVTGGDPWLGSVCICCNALRTSKPPRNVCRENKRAKEAQECGRPTPA